MISDNSILNGRYKLIKKIGQGGFAQVFLATDLVLERQVAVKVLHPELLTDDNETESFLERFGREAKAIAAFDHPNILTIHDYGQAEGTAYLIMPFVEGGTLHDKLRRERALPPAYAFHYLQQAAAALDYAHRRNFVHRDIKPQNMLLRSEDDRLLLADFGIAKVLSSTSSQSRTGAIGTLAYMSPEQLSGAVSRHTDIYALGCVLFLMLTGQLPYTGPTEQVVMGHLTQPVPSIVERSNGKLPPQLQAVIEKALAKKPEDRYQSALELANAFRPFAAMPPISSGSGSTPVGYIPDPDAATQAISKPAQYTPTNPEQGVPRTNPASPATPSVPNLQYDATQGALPSSPITPASYSAPVPASNTPPPTPDTGAGSADATTPLPNRMSNLPNQGNYGASTPGNNAPSDSASLPPGNGVATGSGSVAPLPKPPGNNQTLLFAGLGVVALAIVVLLVFLVTRPPATIETAQNTPGAATATSVATSNPTVSNPAVAATTGTAGTAVGLPLSSLLAVRQYPVTPNCVCLIALSSDGTLVAAMEPVSHTITVLEVASGKVVQKLTGHTEDIRQMVFRPGRNDFLFSAGDDDILRKWDLKTGSVTTPYGGTTSDLRGLAFDSKGDKIFASTAEDTVEIWQTDSGQRRGTLKRADANFIRLAHSPTAGRVAFSDGAGNLWVWDYGSGVDFSQPAHSEYVTSISFSPDGKLLATGSEDKKVILWDATNLRPTKLFEFTSHTELINSVGFSPNSEILVTTSWDASIRFWDTKTGKEVFAFTGHNSGTLGAYFLPDGKTLVSGGADGMVKIWDLPPQAQKGSGGTAPVTNAPLTPATNITPSGATPSGSTTSASTSAAITTYANATTAVATPTPVAKSYQAPSVTVNTAALDKGVKPANPAYVRLALLSPDAPGVDVFINGGKVLEKAPFKTVTGYFEIAPGSYRFEAREPNSSVNSVALLETSAKLEGGTFYTIAPIDLVSKSRPLLLPGDVTYPPFGKSKVRFFQASPDAPVMDLAVKDGRVLVRNLFFGNASNTIPINAGVIDLELREAGTTKVIKTFGGVNFNSGEVNSLFLTDRLASLTLLSTLYQPARPQEADVRLAHLSPDAGALDIYVNGDKESSGVTFQTVGNYTPYLPGKYNVQIRLAGAPDDSPPLLEQMVTLERGKYHSFVLVNPLASLTALQLVDDFGKPASDKARLTVVNTLPDVPALDLTWQNGGAIKNVPTGKNSATVEVAAGTLNYELKNTAGTNVLLNKGEAKIEATKNYTLFIVGNANQLQTVLISD